MNHQALQHQINTLADDIGRLRRRTEPGSYDRILAIRMADHVEWLHLITNPSAAELVAHYAPGDPQAIGGAIDHVDARLRELQHRMRP